MNRWIEPGVAERSRRLLEDAERACGGGVDDNSDTLVSGGTDWCVGCGTRAPYEARGALGDINRADNPDADEL